MTTLAMLFTLPDDGKVAWRFDSWESVPGEHAQTTILRHFPDASDFEPMMFLDCWYFRAAARADSKGFNKTRDRRRWAERWHAGECLVRCLRAAVGQDVRWSA